MALEGMNVEARPANWLPLPCDVIVEDQPVVEEDDLFPKGEIVSFHPRQGFGSLKNSHGHLISFRIGELKLIGPKGSIKYISEGKRVGYDVGWTSDGMHVTKLKVY